MNRDPFITASIHHAYNRGVDKRNIFLDVQDRNRFMRGLYEFNDANPTLNLFHKQESYEVQPRRKVVEVLAYCLMPNHYHLMLRQISDGGITLFMQKLGTGYTMYFNKRYERSGALFQGRFKSVAVESDAQLRYLPHYIHANPIEPFEIDGVTKLGRNPWSSAGTYLRRATDPIADTAFISSLYQEGYEAALRDWLRTREPVVGISLD